MKSLGTLYFGPNCINSNSYQEKNIDEKNINGKPGSVPDTNFEPILIAEAQSTNYNHLIKDLTISKLNRRHSRPFIIYKKAFIKTARNNDYNLKVANKVSIIYKNKNNPLNSVGYHKKVNLSRNEITFESLSKEIRKNKGDKYECDTFNGKIEILLRKYNIKRFKYSQIRNHNLIDKGGSAVVYSVYLQGKKCALKSLDVNLEKKWDNKKFKKFLKE
ncbi:31194_t:CDS:2, partial [Gigaspora margarita]